MGRQRQKQLCIIMQCRAGQGNARRPVITAALNGCWPVTASTLAQDGPVYLASYTISNSTCAPVTPLLYLVVINSLVYHQLMRSWSTPLQQKEQSSQAKLACLSSRVTADRQVLQGVISVVGRARHWSNRTSAEVIKQSVKVRWALAHPVHICR